MPLRSCTVFVLAACAALLTAAPAPAAQDGARSCQARRVMIYTCCITNFAPLTVGNCYWRQSQERCRN